MAYKSDHEFRTDIWKEVTRGLPNNLTKKAHEYLGKQYKDDKDEMNYDQLLSVVKEVMSDYSEWSWNGQRWYETPVNEEDED
jgi:hypothetical protein